MARKLTQAQFDEAARDCLHMSHQRPEVAHAIPASGWTPGDAERDYQASEQLAFRQGSDIFFNRVRSEGCTAGDTRRWS